MKGDKYLYVNVSYEFKDILYIDEVCRQDFHFENHQIVEFASGK